MASPPTEVKHIWGRSKSAICDQYLAISYKWYKMGTLFLWNANRKSYALHQMVLT